MTTRRKDIRPGDRFYDFAGGRSYTCIDCDFAKIVVGASGALAMVPSLSSGTGYGELPVLLLTPDEREPTWVEAWLRWQAENVPQGGL